MTWSRQKRPVIERLMEKVDFNGRGGCWLWTANKTHNGYATIANEGGTTYAHRLAYEHFVGPIPKGLQLDHLCRVRHCVNPQHLEPVTNRENKLRGCRVAARKTHCPLGHAYSGDNVLVRKNGGKVCRTCKRAQERAAYQNRKVTPC